jgi:chemotaxis protein histidine kinase CheA
MIIENDDKMMMMMKRVIFKVLCLPQKKQQKRQTKDKNASLKNCFLREERERKYEKRKDSKNSTKINISLDFNKMSCFLNMVTSSDVIVPRREEQQHQQHHHQYYNGGEYGGAMMTTSVAPRIRVEIANGIRKGEKFITELSGCERVRDFVSMKLCKNEYLRGKEVKVYLDEYELLGDTSVDVLGHEDKIFVVVCDDEGDEMEEEEEVDDGFARVRAELEKREEEKKKEKKKKKKKTTSKLKKETNNRGTRIVNQQHERKQKKHNLEHSLRMAPTMVTMKKVQKKMATVPSKKDERPRLAAQVVYASSSEEDDDDGDSHGLEELSSDEDGGDPEFFVRNVGVQKSSRSLRKNGTPNSKEKRAELPKKKNWQSRLLRNAEKPDWMCRGAGFKWSCTEKKAPGKSVCEKHSRMPKWSKAPVAPPPPPAKKAGKTLEKLENARKAAASSALTCEKCGKVCKGQGPLTMHVRSCKGSDSSIAASPAADETKKGGQPPLLRGKRVPIKLLRKCARNGGVKSILAELVVNYRIGARSNVPVTAMVPAQTPVATAIAPILASVADADKKLSDLMAIAKKKAEDTKKRLEHELRVEGEKLEKAKKEELEERKRLEALKSKAEIERLEAARKMEEEKEKRKAEEERRVAAEAEAKRVERVRVEEALKMKAEQEKKAAAEREKVEAARQKQIEEARLEAARKMEEEVRLQAAKKKMAEEEEKRRHEEHEKLEKEKKVNDEARRGRSKDATVERQEKEVEEVTPLMKSSIVLKPGEVACGAPTNKQVMCPYPAKTCPWHIHGDGDDKDDQVHHNRRHLLTSGDIGPSLKGKWISVLWPDTGEWFDGEILNMNNSTAKLWYPADDLDDATLGEREDINLEEAIEGNEISWPLVARKPLTLQAKLVDETSSLDILRDYITSCGGKLEGNWSVQVKVRQSGQSALTGHVDHYFFSPEGKKYRSKVEVARALNVPKLPKSAKKRKVVYNKDDDIGTPPPKNRKETHSQRLSDKTAAAAAVAAATTAATPYGYGSPEASPDYFLQRSFDGENETNLSDSFLTNTTNINTIITDAITNVDEKINQQQGGEYNNRNTTDRDDNASSPLPPLFKNKSGERMELTVHQNDGWM